MTWTVLHDACERQDATNIALRCRQCIEEALCVDDQGSTPLHITAWSGGQNTAIVRVLVQAQPQAVVAHDVYGDTPLHVLLYKNGSNVDPGLVRCLIEACPRVLAEANMEGLLPLHAACRYCASNDEVISILVQSNVLALHKRIKRGLPAPAKRRTKGKTKEKMEHLHPIIDGNIRSARTADLRLEDRRRGQIRDGAFPLHMLLASRVPSLQIVKLFVSNAPDVLAWKDNFGRTPLQVALMQHGLDTGILDYLLASNSEVLSVPDNAGNLPLHTAYLCEAQQLFIDRISDTYPKACLSPNKKGQLPFQVRA